MVDVHDRADQAVDEHLLQNPGVVRVPHDVADGEGDVGLAHVLHDPAAGTGGGGHRLFQENRIAQPGKGGDRLLVHGVLRADQHGIGQPGLLRQRLPGAERHLPGDAMLADDPLAVELAGLGHADDPDLLRALLRIVGVAPATSARADYDY